MLQIWLQKTRMTREEMAQIELRCGYSLLLNQTASMYTDILVNETSLSCPLLQHMDSLTLEYSHNSKRFTTTPIPLINNLQPDRFTLMNSSSMTQALFKSLTPESSQLYCRFNSDFYSRLESIQDQVFGCTFPPSETNKTLSIFDGATGIDLQHFAYQSVEMPILETVAPQNVYTGFGEVFVRGDNLDSVYCALDKENSVTLVKVEEKVFSCLLSHVVQSQYLLL